MFGIRIQTRKSRKGFTLIELAIVMGVASLLFAGLWRMMASGNTQVRDQAVAEQHREFINAVSSFLETTEAQTWLAAQAASTNFELTLPTDNDDLTDCQNSITETNLKGICEYLPVGFTEDTTNAYGQTYSVRVLKDSQAMGTAPKTYSFMIITEGGDDIPDTSGGRISGLIGSDGGFIYSTDVCGTDYACGAFGAWSVDPVAKYGFSSVDEAHIATRTYSVMNISQSTPWLARSEINQGPELTLLGASATAGPFVYDYNTLQSDTYLGEVASSGDIAFLYGAASDAYYGGGVKRVREVDVGTVDSTGGNPPLNVTSPCTRTSLTDTSCLEAANINGDMYISGFLHASKLYAGQFIYNTESDRRLKKNIKPIDDPLAKIGTLGAYSFEIKKSGEKKLGLIAQEVQKVFPEVVHKIDSEYWGIDYPGLIGPLVGAVNELRKGNLALKSQLEAQAKEIKALRDLIGTEEPEEETTEELPVKEE